jgi:SpoVK/Ycf46/Vps4 family AAA+-type ATPase
MPIDISNILRGEFARAHDAYEKAVDTGNSLLASQQAARCADLLTQLAKNDPSGGKAYLESAKKWKETAEAVKKEGIRKPPVSEEEHKDAASEFHGYVESLISTSEVTWDDIGGLEEAKRLLQETVVVAAMKKPEAIKPWRGILLYGPPGTGKTLMAAAAAGSLKASFFNVSADKVLSKYYGESSRLIAALYEVAMEKAPSIVFIDELDSLTLSRSGDLDEATRRTLSTFLSQLDGFKNKKSARLVMTLAATNSPWDIDSAALSRFPRRIYIPLPDAKAAVDIVKASTKGLDTSRLEFGSVALECEKRFFSGRDISYLCQQAIWNMIRDQNRDLPQLSVLPIEELSAKSIKTRPLAKPDFDEAFEKIKIPLKPQELGRYAKWSEEFGS